MAFVVIRGIEEISTSSKPGQISLLIGVGYIHDNGYVDYRQESFEFPIAATNWKNEIASRVRANTLAYFGETVPVNGVLYEDFSRG